MEVNILYSTSFCETRDFFRWGLLEAAADSPRRKWLFYTFKDKNVYIYFHIFCLHLHLCPYACDHTQTQVEIIFLPWFSGSCGGSGSIGMVLTKFQREDQGCPTPSRYHHYRLVVVKNAFSLQKRRQEQATGQKNMCTRALLLLLVWLMFDYCGNIALFFRQIRQLPRKKKIRESIFRCIF